jgi:hypothetical protein
MLFAREVCTGLRLYYFEFEGFASWRLSVSFLIPPWRDTATI